MTNTTHTIPKYVKHVPICKVKAMQHPVVAFNMLERIVQQNHARAYTGIVAYTGIIAVFHNGSEVCKCYIQL